MSLARAFTTRRTKLSQVSPPMPQRSLTTKQFPAGTINRSQISSPIELISTTNMLSYNAPDIYPSSSSSQSSDDDLDSLPPLTSSPVTSPDNSSAGSAPGSPDSNKPPLYFGSSGRQSTSSEDAPAIPRRALSHTKKTHEILSRKRSLSRASQSSSKHSVTSFARDSIQMFSTTIVEDATPEPHPFGNELAQVTELAEEFGIQSNMAVIDEEEQELINLGLLKFDAADYMSEIESYFTAAFCDPAPIRTVMWI
jgi:hypothetical protein